MSFETLPPEDEVPDERSDEIQDAEHGGEGRPVAHQEGQGGRFCGAGPAGCEFPLSKESSSEIDLIFQSTLFASQGWLANYLRNVLGTPPPAASAAGPKKEEKKEEKATYDESEQVSIDPGAVWDKKPKGDDQNVRRLRFLSRFPSLCLCDV